jgi:hypothetical protein
MDPYFNSEMRVGITKPQGLCPAMIPGSEYKTRRDMDNVLCNAREVLLKLLQCNVANNLRDELSGV